MNDILSPKIVKHGARSIVVSAMAITFLMPRAANPENPEVPPIGTSDSIPSFMLPSGSPEQPKIGDSPFPTAGNVRDMYDIENWKERPWEMPRWCIKSLTQSPSIATWGNGAIYADGGVMEFPGLMGVESGRLNLQQTFGPVTITAWAGATKYGYFRGLQTSYGFGGSIDYRISDRWSVTLFGLYHTPLHPLTPAMAEGMNPNRFGGYASYNFNDHWGISVGAQATQSMVANRWEAQPIVMPYYRVNEKVNIGVDVGGIIYNVAKDYIEGRNNGGPVGSPVIAPPRSGPPPVGPRR